MGRKGIGIHLLLRPEVEIQSGFASIIEDKIESGCEKHGLELIELSILNDHIHILIRIESEGEEDNIFKKRDLEGFLLELGSSARDSIQNIFGEEFEWVDAINVMVLPINHIEILASFLRDQENLHKRMTLEEEIEEVFSNPYDEDEGDEDENGRYNSFRYN